MLKQAATVDDRVKAKPQEIDADRRIPAGRENHDDCDFENRWTPVALTLALDEAESEI